MKVCFPPKRVLMFNTKIFLPQILSISGHSLHAWGTKNRLLIMFLRTFPIFCNKKHFFSTKKVIFEQKNGHLSWCAKLFYSRIPIPKFHFLILLFILAQGLRVFNSYPKITKETNFFSLTSLSNFGCALFGGV